MNINRMIVLFLIERNKINKKGLCPLKCRITYLSKRKIFSIGLFVNPEHWNSKKQKIVPLVAENNIINTQLSLISQKINEAFLFLKVNENNFDVDDIYRQYKGESIKKDKTIVEAFMIHISRQEKLIGVSTTKVSVAKFYQTLKHIKSYIKWKYNKSDYLLDNMKMTFIIEFEYYLKSEKKFKPSTIYKTLQRFRQVVKIAVGLDFITKDPFLLHKNKKPKKEVVFLTQEELKKLENYHFASLRLEQVKDMFVFCCYTGLAYQEMTTLSSEHLVKGFDGNIWIKMMRRKTNSSVSIPLLPKSKEILDKYKNQERLLPLISNQRFNSYLKEIAEILGIEKVLTHHIARKTFATTVLLYNGVPMEIVSELLGHSKMSTTQEYYAKVVKNRVSEEITKLNSKLK